MGKQKEKGSFFQASSEISMYSQKYRTLIPKLLLAHKQF